MPQLINTNVSIVDPVTHTAFEEYKVSTTPNTTECYIESESEKQFSISVHLKGENLIHTTATYSVKVWVDGKYIRSTLIGKIGQKVYTNSEIVGVNTGPCEYAPLIFGNTQFSGDIYFLYYSEMDIEEGQIDTSRLSKLGSITIKIVRVRILKESFKPRTIYFNKEQRTQGTLNEKAKKALLTHSVKYFLPLPFHLTN